MAWVTVWVSEERKAEIEAENALFSRPVDVSPDGQQMQVLDDEYAGIVRRPSFDDLGGQDADEDDLVTWGYNLDGSDAWEDEDEEK